jgi:hypothetical protein
MPDPLIQFSGCREVKSSIDTNWPASELLHNEAFQKTSAECRLLKSNELAVTNSGVYRLIYSSLYHKNPAQNR